MLLVLATKGPSPIHGDGLIARQLIPKGTVVWEFVQGFDLLISSEQFERLSDSAKQCVKYYGFIDTPTNGWILSSDDDRFTNHSTLPNTAYAIDNSRIAGGGDHRKSRSETYFPARKSRSIT